MVIMQAIIVADPDFTDQARIPMEQTVPTKDQIAHSFIPVKQAVPLGLPIIHENQKALLDMAEALVAVVVLEDLESRTFWVLVSYYWLLGKLSRSNQ